MQHLPPQVSHLASGFVAAAALRDLPDVCRTEV